MSALILEARGTMAVLRHELRVGWRAPVTIAALELLVALVLSQEHIRLRSTQAAGSMVFLVVLVGVPLALARLHAETAAGSFLATRTVSRLGALMAKGLATAVDMGIVAGASWVLVWQIRRASAAVSFEELAWLAPFTLVGLATVAALTFGLWSSLPSAWAAAGLTVLGVVIFLLVTAGHRVDPRDDIVVRGLLVGIPPLALAACVGRAWMRGAS